MLNLFKTFISYVGIVSVLTVYSKARHIPIKINNSIMLIYNGINSMCNLYIVWGLARYFMNFNFGMSIPYNEDIHRYIFLHYLTKYLDFFDTIFMILRHRWKQVHFLQLFHHSTIGVVWQYILYMAPHHSASIAFGALACIS